MPVGVPKVGIYYIPDDNDSESESHAVHPYQPKFEPQSMAMSLPKPKKPEFSWVDIYHILHRERLLLLCQEATTEPSNTIIGLLISLGIDDPTKDIFLMLNCPGGKLISGLGIYDTIQMVEPDVHTAALGLVASVGSLILIGGTTTKRLAYPHSRVMIHQPTGSILETRTGDFVLDSNELLSVRGAITEIFAHRTGKPLSVIVEDMERDTFMSPKEAQSHGIVDRVGFPNYGFR